MDGFENAPSFSNMMSLPLSKWEDSSLLAIESRYSLSGNSTSHNDSSRGVWKQGVSVPQKVEMMQNLMSRAHGSSNMELPPLAFTEGAYKMPDFGNNKRQSEVSAGQSLLSCLASEGLFNQNGQRDGRLSGPNFGSQTSSSLINESGKSLLEDIRLLNALRSARIPESSQATKVSLPEEDFSSFWDQIHKDLEKDIRHKIEMNYSRESPKMSEHEKKEFIGKNFEDHNMGQLMSCNDIVSWEKKYSALAHAALRARTETRSKSPQVLRHSSPVRLRNFDNRSPVQNQRRSPINSLSTSPKSYRNKLPVKYRRSPNQYRSQSPAQILSDNRYEIYRGQSPREYRSQSPTRYRSQSPKRYRSQSPTRYRSKSPTRYRSRSPTKYRSRSPIRYGSGSPIRYRSRSPTRYRSRSPTRYRSRTPTRYGNRSPTRYRSQSPTRYISRSPARYGSRSPTRYISRSPTRYISRSPTRYRSRSPTGYKNKSPGMYRKRSPSMYRSYSSRIHRSRSPGMYESHASGMNKSRSPGIYESHASGRYRSRSPGMFESHASGWHRSRSPGMFESHASGRYRSRSPGMFESHATGGYKSRSPGMYKTHASGRSSVGYGSKFPKAYRSKSPPSYDSRLQTHRDVEVSPKNPIDINSPYKLIGALRLIESAITQANTPYALQVIHSDIIKNIFTMSDEAKRAMFLEGFELKLEVVPGGHVRDWKNPLSQLLNSAFGRQLDLDVYVEARAHNDEMDIRGAQAFELAEYFRESNVVIAIAPIEVWERRTQEMGKKKKKKKKGTVATPEILIVKSQDAGPSDLRSKLGSETLKQKYRKTFLSEDKRDKWKNMHSRLGEQDKKWETKDKPFRAYLNDRFGARTSVLSRLGDRMVTDVPVIVIDSD